MLKGLTSHGQITEKLTGVVFEKIDWFLCSTSWLELFSNSQCSNLSIFRSGHNPMFMNAVKKANFFPRPARFEAWWFLALDIMRNNWNKEGIGSHFLKVMKRNQLTMKELHKWNKDRHGKIKEKN